VGGARRFHRGIGGRVAAYVIASGTAIDGTLFRHAASETVLGYSVTPLSAWFLMVLGLIAVPVALYSTGYFAHAVARPRTAAVGAAFTAMVRIEVVFVADGVIAFLCGWEVMTLATAALVATEHESRASRRAAYLFLVMSHVGTGCLMAGFLILASAAGSLSFPVILSGHVVSGPVRHGVFALFFIGFGVKAGLIPFHVWLPEAHPAAPSSVSAFMSAVLITAGIYGLFRVCAFGLGPPDVNSALVFMSLGTLSAILGVLYALTQTDVKRLLAYSTIENAGIIVLGLGAALMALAHGRNTLAAVAVAASLMHVLNHAIFKGLLFLGAGSVVMATGTRHIEQFGGLMRRMPWTGLCFLVGALAISALPLLNGFPSEWLTFQALLLGFSSTPGMIRLNFPLAAALLALTSWQPHASCGHSASVFTAADQAASEAHESPSEPPLGFLAACDSGAVSGLVLRAPKARRTHGLPQHLGRRGSGMSSGSVVDHLVPAMFGLAFGGLIVSGLLTTGGRDRPHMGMRR
jgi:formate hydrogenlyase subunit 3/multisubunit Na+/H+ antiporter MnhD subunit